MKKIAIFASGSGTNAENIVNFFHEGNRLRVDLVLTDKKDAFVQERMKPLGVECIYFPRSVWRDEPQKIVGLLRQHEIDLVVLAGFNALVNAEIVKAFPMRMLNLHPSLLPEFGGKGMWGHHVHEAVLAAGKTESGLTVHYVDNNFDTGEILMQQKVEVLPDDTPESLEQRIHQAEYSLYPRAIAEALRRLDNNRDTDRKWAEVLNVPYSPAETSTPEMPTPPPVNTKTPPPLPPSSNPVPPSMIVPPHSEPMPPTYLIWSILATIFCCFVPGLIAIIASSRVSSLYYSNDLEGAKRASRNAEIWIIVSFCLGVLSATLYVPFAFI